MGSLPQHIGFNKKIVSKMSEKAFIEEFAEVYPDNDLKKEYAELQIKPEPKKAPEPKAAEAEK